MVINDNVASAFVRNEVSENDNEEIHRIPFGRRFGLEH